jgi:hypothetical protein
MNAPADPSFPEPFMVALDRLDVTVRASGRIVLGMGPPFFEKYLRDAIAARFGFQDAELDRAEEAARSAIREQERAWRRALDAPRDPRDTWVHRWMF